MAMTPQWYRTKNGPGLADTMLGDRLFHFDMFGEHGVLDENGVRWYRLNCSFWFGDWIETQDKNVWEIYGDQHRAIYIVREDFMTLIRLKFL